MPDKANDEVISDHGRKGFLGRSGKLVAIALAVLAGVFLLAAAGIAWATYDYSEEYENRILPGSYIAGADVGGLTGKEAVKLVRSAIAPKLDREITLRHEGKTWTVTPRKLGAHGYARKVVDEALTFSRNASFLDKMRLRFDAGGDSFQDGVGIAYSRAGARAFIEGLSEGFDREAKDATVDYSSGWVEVVPEQKGRKVRRDDSVKALMQALKSGDSDTRLAVKSVEPEVTTDKFDQVLLLRIGENKLYLYEDGEITHKWTVATGQPEYPTPTGLYEITEKRYLPTWVNPDPTGWGASMPASIPPGPGNPLGTRALNWSAPAIRFHGTQATYSLGYNASHGCVRMAMPDVEALYDMVDVGTPIVSTIVDGLKPLYGTSAPDPRGG